MLKPAGPTACGVADQPIRARIRPDLRATKTLHRNEAAIVVKDPVAMKYHRLRPDEYFVLHLLDGRRSLQEIREAYEQRFAPWRVSTADLNQLVFRFHQTGLLLADAPMQGDRLSEKRDSQRVQRWKQHISGILFIRFPGVDPEPLLRRLYPIVSPLLSKFGAMAALLICLAAAITMMLQWPRLVAEFPEMSAWLRVDSLFILALVIGGTKVLHEVGHAMACKHFGGECHEIGPMLLVFTPALYCDTSDSWTLSSRWHRAAVGMAGVAAEVLLAALATILWACTAPGTIHYVAMNVMLVCSVSTLLFNANPLLRYDGYYVLSDLCDVPNLGQRSRMLLARHLKRLFLGVDEPSEAMALGANVWMTIYALVAVAYRWALMLLILWFVSCCLRPYGLESLGWMICVIAACGLLATAIRPVVQFLRHPARRRQIRSRRTLITASVGGVLLACLFYPLPARISADGRLVARQETPVFISTAGFLKSTLKRPGDRVREGELIATLVNPDVEQQYLAAKGRYETQLSIVESIRRMSVGSPMAAADLPGQRAMLEDLHQQLRRRERRRDGLRLTAPAGGTLVEAPWRNKPDDDIQLARWSGFPTDHQNDGCLLDPGNELMTIVSAGQWDAELIVAQSDIDRIAVGASVQLATDAAPGRIFTGRVRRISDEQWTSHQNASRRDDIGGGQKHEPRVTSYVVRVELPGDQQQWVTGAKVISLVDAEPMSLARRISRMLSGLLRFR